MSGFEFTPQGILPLGSYRPQVEEGDIAGATADVPRPDAVRLPPQTVIRRAGRDIVAAPPPPHVEPQKLRPVDVVRLAKARLREVERDIRRLQKLEAERDELKRLISAADNKPMAVVRTLPNRSA